MAAKKKKTGRSSARGGDEDRRHRLDAIQKVMDDLTEMYGDPQRNKEVLRECVAAIEAYAEYAKSITGDQYTFNLQSKYLSETVVDTFVDESTVAAESGFANLFEVFLDKLHEMAGLLPVSKTGKAKAKEGINVNVKERTNLIKSHSDAKGRATGEKVGSFKNTGEEKSEKDLVGLEEQLMKMRYRSLHQNNRYVSSTYQYNGGINVSTNLGTDKIFCKY